MTEAESISAAPTPLTYERVDLDQIADDRAVKAIIIGVGIVYSGAESFARLLMEYEYSSGSQVIGDLKWRIQFWAILAAHLIKLFVTTSLTFHKLLVVAARRLMIVAAAILAGCYFTRLINLASNTRESPGATVINLAELLPFWLSHLVYCWMLLCAVRVSTDRAGGMPPRRIVTRGVTASAIVLSLYFIAEFFRMIGPMGGLAAYFGTLEWASRAICRMGFLVAACICIIAFRHGRTSVSRSVATVVPILIFLPIVRDLVVDTLELRRNGALSSGGELRYLCESIGYAIRDVAPAIALLVMGWSLPARRDA